MIWTPEGASPSLASSSHLFSLNSLRPRRTHASHLRLHTDEVTIKVCFLFRTQTDLRGWINVKHQMREVFTLGAVKTGAWPRLSTSGMALMLRYPAEQVWLSAQSWGNRNRKKCIVGVWNADEWEALTCDEALSRRRASSITWRSSSVSPRRELLSVNPISPEEKTHCFRYSDESVAHDAEKPSDVTEALHGSEEKRSA